MLAKPTKGISAILDRFQGLAFTSEYKYDGERAQVSSCLYTCLGQSHCQTPLRPLFLIDPYNGRRNSQDLQPEHGGPHWEISRPDQLYDAGEI